MSRTCLCLASLVVATAVVEAQPTTPTPSTPVRFKKITATREFWAEGADLADFNRDGKVDVVSGPFWYEGPTFQKRHEIYPATASFKHKKADGTEEVIAGWEGAQGEQNAYSDCFLSFSYDFNGDKWPDMIVYPHPGQPAVWYENPQGRDGHWPKHEVYDNLENESPGFADITGDGKPELLCCSRGYLGYVRADWKRPADPWKFHAVSPKGDYQKYSHGLGYGDINGDGRIDLLDKDAWWEQPAILDGDPVWKRHPWKFSPGAAQMIVFDVNADGLNDVICSLNPHGYGLVWYEQVRAGGEITFRDHVILNADATPNKYGVQFSQGHAIDLVDIDGDGIKDLVTGKRFWAHGKNGPDPDSNGQSLLYWFKLTRPSKGTAEYIPYKIDDDSGVGTQVMTGRINGDKRPDIVVGNKKGVFIFLQER